MEKDRAPRWKPRVSRTGMRTTHRSPVGFRVVAVPNKCPLIFQVVVTVGTGWKRSSELLSRSKWFHSTESLVIHLDHTEWLLLVS